MSRRFAAWLLVALAGCSRSDDRGVAGDAGADARAPSRASALGFVRDGGTRRTLTLGEMLAGIETVRFRAYDPYYAREKEWRALPLAKVVALGFDAPVDALRGLEFVLRATDGFTVPMRGEQLFEPGAYVAYEDVDAASWEPIGPQRANPGPFYVVWREKHQQSLETHPRPWQLATIEITPFEKTYPHTVPRRGDAIALRGFALFRAGCIHCHAINREGGRVGPELNVPQSIVEYRPEPQIRAYIKDPRTFRYGNMPAHPHLTEADLDALLGYFRAMQAEKFDADASRDGG